jgi:hypothetical protein
LEAFYVSRSDYQQTDNELKFLETHTLVVIIYVAARYALKYWIWSYLLDGGSGAQAKPQ